MSIYTRTVRRNRGDETRRVLYIRLLASPKFILCNVLCCFSLYKECETQTERVSYLQATKSTI